MNLLIVKVYLTTFKFTQGSLHLGKLKSIFILPYHVISPGQKELLLLSEPSRLGYRSQLWTLIIQYAGLMKRFENSNLVLTLRGN